MTSGKTTTPYVMGQVRTLHNQNVPVRQIAARLRMNKSTVERILKNRMRDPETIREEDGPVPNSIQELNQLRETVAEATMTLAIMGAKGTDLVKMAKYTVATVSLLCDSEEAAWGLIANAWGGDWDQASEKSGWKVAAEKWRDEYHKLLPPLVDDKVEKPIEPGDPIYHPATGQATVVKWESATNEEPVKVSIKPQKQPTDEDQPVKVMLPSKAGVLVDTEIPAGDITTNPPGKATSKGKRQKKTTNRLEKQPDEVAKADETPVDLP